MAHPDRATCPASYTPKLRVRGSGLTHCMPRGISPSTRSFTQAQALIVYPPRSRGPTQCTLARHVCNMYAATARAPILLQCTCTSSSAQPVHLERTTAYLKLHVRDAHCPNHVLGCHSLHINPGEVDVDGTGQSPKWRSARFSLHARSVQRKLYLDLLQSADSSGRVSLALVWWGSGGRAAGVVIQQVQGTVLLWYTFVWVEVPS